MTNVRNQEKIFDANINYLSTESEYIKMLNYTFLEKQSKMNLRISNHKMVNHYDDVDIPTISIVIPDNPNIKIVRKEDPDSDPRYINQGENGYYEFSHGIDFIYDYNDDKFVDRLINFLKNNTNFDAASILTFLRNGMSIEDINFFKIK